MRFNYYNTYLINKELLSYIFCKVLLILKWQHLYTLIFIKIAL